MLVSIVAGPTYIPTNSGSSKGVPLLHALSRTCRLFKEGHSVWCEVTPHCGFDVHFFSNNQQW